MARTLAIVEATFLFGAACMMSLVWGQTVILEWRDVTAILGQAGIVACCCIVAFYYNDLYDLRVTRTLRAFAPRLVQSIGMAFILLAIFYMAFPDARLADGSFVSSVLIVGSLFLPVRAVVYGIMRRRTFAERVIVLGTSGLAAKLVKAIDDAPDCGLQVIGVADDGPGADPTAFNSCPLLGPLERFAKIVDELKPEQIIVALRERRGRVPVRELLDAQLKGVSVEDGVDVYERLTGKIAIEALTPSNLIYSAAFRKTRRQLRTRRLANVVVSAAGAVVSLPLMAVIAVAIKLDSPGPVLFRQPRCGLRGRTFDLIKFRTMHAAVPDAAASVWLRNDEARVTRVGRWLRKLRLDELPQFWNIVKGDMSIVGPRPEMASNVETMTEHIPYYMIRHSIPPGITGWAQIKQGYSVNLDEVTEKMRYDLYYVKHMSFLFDLRILVDTVKIVLFGRGAR